MSTALMIPDLNFMPKHKKRSILKRWGGLGITLQFKKCFWVDEKKHLPGEHTLSGDGGVDTDHKVASGFSGGAFQGSFP